MFKFTFHKKGAWGKMIFGRLTRRMWQKCSLGSDYKSIICGDGEVAQLLRALATLADDLASVSTIHIVAHNSL